MQWHKAKVSNLQYSLSLEKKQAQAKKIFLKRGRYFEIKEVGRIGRD